MNKTNEPPKIKADTMIADIVEEYPLVVDYLIDEYDFYCFNCMMSEFETLEEGCILHGIEGEDFTELLERVNELA